MPNPENDEVLNRWLHERNRLWLAPDPSEEVRLRKKVAENQETIASIDARVRSLQDQIYVLKEQRLPVQLQLNSCQSLLSPIRRLPPDVLISIFGYLNFEATICVKDKDSDGLIWSRNDARHVLAVCSAWNTMACSHAQFWASFRFDLQDSSLKSTSSERIEALQGRLCSAIQRSASVPLSVRIEALDEPYAYPPLVSTHAYDLSDFLGPVLAEAHRWRHLHLRVTPKHLADECLSRCFRGCLDGLESLVYQYTYPTWSIVNTSDMFSDTPRLREVVYINTRGGLRTFNIPWGQLHFLSVQNDRHHWDRSPTYLDCTDILALTTSLRMLESQCHPLKKTMKGPKVLLPITSLKVNRWVDLDLLGKAFELPRLTELFIKEMYHFVPPLLPQVMSTLQRLEVEIVNGESFPMFLLDDSGLHFPRLVELLVKSSKSPHEEKDHPAFGKLQSLSTRFPCLAKFECHLGDGSTAISLRDWSYVLCSFRERLEPFETSASPFHLTKTRLTLHGPLQEKSPIIPMLRDLILNGTVIGVVYNSGNTATKFTWTLEASDVDSSQTFIQQQNLQLERYP